MELLTYGERLRNISLSIDIVDDDTLNDIKRNTKDYFKKLGIDFFEFLVPGIVDGGEGLHSEWHNGNQKWSQKLRNDIGEYKGQISYSFDKKRTLCIISENGGKLSQKDNVYKNIWGNKNEILDNFPPYVDLSNSDTYASIMIPLVGDNERKIGIINFEFDKNFENTFQLQNELYLITDAFKTLYVLNRANQTQKVNTNQAISSLSRLDSFPLNFNKPKVFVASSKSADSLVLKSIESVLMKFTDDVEVDYWYKIDEAGNITSQILNSISNCSFGICYLSEFIDHSEGQLKFKDNPNVMFEAGMIHGLSRISKQGPKNWIPIREKEEYAGRIPFDIASERRLVVPRSIRGEFEKEEFETKLEEMLNRLVE